MSVSTQRDPERALIAKETDTLHQVPDEELGELAHLLQAKGSTRTYRPLSPRS